MVILGQYELSDEQYEQLLEDEILDVYGLRFDLVADQVYIGEEFAGPDEVDVVELDEVQSY